MIPINKLNIVSTTTIATDLYPRNNIKIANDVLSIILNNLTTLVRVNFP